MQIEEGPVGAVSGVMALIGLIIHIAGYANKEGKKEQRLSSLEDRVKALSPLEAEMARMSANVTALDGKIDSIKSDIRGDIHDLRSYLMSRQG